MVFKRVASSFPPWSANLEENIHVSPFSASLPCFSPLSPQLDLQIPSDEYLQTHLSPHRPQQPWSRRPLGQLLHLRRALPAPRQRSQSYHLMNTNPCGCVPAARSPGGLSSPPDTQTPPPGSLPVPRVPRRLAPAPPCRSPGTCPAQDPGPLHWPFLPPTCVPPHAFSAGKGLLIFIKISHTRGASPDSPSSGCSSRAPEPCMLPRLPHLVVWARGLGRII